MKINVQPIEKSTPETAALDVHSIFPTIQGEGPFVGRAAIFVRLAGCNLQCPLCDTEYTSGRQLLSFPVIFDAIQEHLTVGFLPLIVITGGEPLRQGGLNGFVRYLLARGYDVQIETNGTLAQPLPWEDENFTVVCSPKAGKIHRDMEHKIHYYKYVLKFGDIDMGDGLPIRALDHPVHHRVARPPVYFDKHKIYVQPADEQDSLDNQLNLKVAIQSCRHYGYTLCLQTHKIINLP